MSFLYVPNKGSEKMTYENPTVHRDSNGRYTISTSYNATVDNLETGNGVLNTFKEALKKEHIITTNTSMGEHHCIRFQVPFDKSVDLSCLSLMNGVVFIVEDYCYIYINSMSNSTAAEHVSRH
ncbi:ORF36 [white sturgeon herpesvirus 2]|uniref:ORF36 n=1 Tax=white sturgeon herpesvirus 2 TaxID=320884 RepID=F6GQ74_9VIRU|nr:ORF36 [Acipenserid herpesvirus 2]AEF97694.1 ORF36 [Acipenserid herpesvirus 2]